MEIYGNPTTFNLERVLQQNISACDFFRNDCIKLNAWSEVIDQIYYDVTAVEPWLGGNARGASTAFCLLFRLFQLKLSEQEIQDTITHPDSPYIRAIGFLYLRYAADPKILWDWMGDYADDKEEFKPSGPNGTTVTMGDFVRDLLLEQYYFETIFPRIPKKVQDDIIDSLRARHLPTTGKGNAGAGGLSRRGDDEGNRRPASVKASLSVAFGQRAPNRANTREDGAKRGEALRTDVRGSDRRATDDSRRARSRSPYEGRNGGSRNGDRRDERHVRDERGSYRDERSGRDERYGDRRAGSYGRSDERGRHRSSRSRTPDRDRRRRSRSRDRSAGRDTRDVFKESAAGMSRAADVGDELRSRYGDASSRPGDERRHRGERGGGSSRGGGEEVYRLGGGGRR